MPHPTAPDASDEPTETATATHTPGPWRISSFEPSSGGTNRMVMGADNFAVAYISGRTEAEHEADARLIAASPSLFAVLTGAGGISPEEMEDAADLVEAENGYLGRQLRGAAIAARAAIAKATQP